MKFVKDATIKFGETLIIGDFLRLEEDQDGRVSIRATGGGGSGFVLDDLSDVTISSPSTAQVLRYNGTFWVNALLALDDLSDAAISSPATAQVIRYNGSTWVNAALTAADIGAGNFPGGTFGFGGGKITIDGTDSTIAAGEIGLAENVGNLYLGTRGSMFFDVDNDNNQSTAVWSWTRHALGQTIMSLVEDGTLTIEVANSSILNITDNNTSSSSAGGHILLGEDDGAALNIDHRLGGIAFTAFDGTSFGSQSARIEAFASETFSATGHGTRLRFRTTPVGSTTLSVRQEILADGSVVIGTDPGGSALLRVGGGNLRVSNTSTSIESIATSTGASVIINRPASQLGDVSWQTNNVARWTMRANSATESGANAGTNLEIIARNDDGSAIDSWFVVNRVSSGNIMFSPTGSRNVVIGIDPGGSQKLRVGGGAEFGSSAAAALDVFIDRPAGQTGGLSFVSAGSARWGVYVTEAAEPGDNTGSNFRIRARTDAGVFLDDPITINRVASGTIALGSLGSRPVVIGVDPGGSENLRVGGEIHAEVSTANNPTVLNVRSSSGTQSNDTVFIGAGANNSGYNLLNISHGSSYSLPAVKVTGAGTTILGTDPTWSARLRVGGNVVVSGTLAVGNVQPPSSNNLMLASTGRVDVLTYNSVGGVDEKWWTISQDGAGGANSWGLATRDDAGTLGNWVLRAQRSGTSITSLRLVENSGALVVAGDPGTTEQVRIGGRGTVLIKSGTGGALTLVSDGSGQTHINFGSSGSIDGQGGEFQIRGNVPVVVYTGGVQRMTVNTDGTVVIGTDPGGNNQLRVDRSIRAKEEIFSMSASGTQNMYSPSSIMFGTGSTGTNFRGGFSHNIHWNGANWRALTDGSNSAGQMILGGVANDGLEFFTLVSSGTASQTITNNAMNSFYRRLRIGNTGITTSNITFFIPSVAGEATIGTATNPWGDHYTASSSKVRWGENSGGVWPYLARDAGTGGLFIGTRTSSTDTDRFNISPTLATSLVDFKINNLGTFDSSDTPTDNQILVYHAGSTNKWQAESIQLVYNAGDANVGLLTDNTSVAYVYLDPGSGADSPSGAPPVPVIKLWKHHKAITVQVLASSNPDIEYHDGASFPADFRRFVYEYSIDNFTTPLPLVTATSDKVVHGRLTAGTTYYYRVKAEDRAGNFSATSSVVSVVADADSDTAAYGILLASEIAVDRLAALSANIGICATGQIRDTLSNPLHAINFGGVGGIPSTVRDVINFENTQIPSGTKFIVDFHRNRLTINDQQQPPVNRVNLGQVASGIQDYGIQVYDVNAAKVLDFTGSKRIMAVPIQNLGIKSGTVNIDLSTGLTQQMIIGSGATTLVFSGAVDGSRYRFWLQQSTLGNCVMPTVDNIVMWSGDVPPVLSTTPGVFDIIELEYRSAPSPRFAGWQAEENIFLPAPRVVSFTETTFFSVPGPTDHPATMPSTVTSGNLLLMLFCCNSNPTITDPGGWTLLKSMAMGGTAASYRLYGIISSGTISPTVNIVTSTQQQGGAQVYQVDRWYGTMAGVEVSTGATGNNTNPNPDSLTTTWPADRNLYIPFMGFDVGGSSIDSYPANYTNGESTDGGSQADGVMLGSARRQWYATTEDPGTFTVSIGARQWAACTLAVRPIA
jgi:hypothetical protein